MINKNKLVAVAMAATLAATAAGSVLAQAQPAANAAKRAQAATPETVFNGWDKDKSKSLSLDEFRAGWSDIQRRQVVGKLHQNFVAMDTNKSGALEQSEFSNLELVKKAGSKAPMMSAYDTDKNGKLDFKEYVQLISTMVKNN